MDRIASVVVIVLCCYLDIIVCMRMISMDVPRYETVGGEARLVCNFELGRETLYSVKWYKDGNEFYRYVPKDHPRSQVFRVPHVFVDQRRSNDREVWLTNLSLESAGIYTCEASSEAPRFKTISGQAKMQMVDLPDSRPVLTGAQSRGYKVGEWLDVNCSAPNSVPPARLKWYINHEVVDSDYLIRYAPLKSQSGLYTSILRLRFRLKRDHFKQDHVNVKCTATVYTEYFESSELFLQGLGLGEKALESRRTNAGVSLLTGLCWKILMILLSLSLLLIN